MTTMKYGGGILPFCGCFSAKGVGKLHKIGSNMNAEMYIDIIKTTDVDSLNDWRGQIENTVILQDNDNKHKSKKTLNFLKTAKITLLD